MAQGPEARQGHDRQRRRPGAPFNPVASSFYLLLLVGSVVAPLAPSLDAMRQGRGLADTPIGVLVRSDRDDPRRAGRHGPRSTRTE